MMLPTGRDEREISLANVYRGTSVQTTRVIDIYVPHSDKDHCQ